MSSFPELAEPLTGAAARVRPAAERDIPEILIAHQDDPQMHARLGLPRPPSGAQLGRRCEEAAAERAAGRGVWLTIVPAGSDELCGQIGVHDVDWDHLRADVGIWIRPALRGQGLAADALRLTGRWLLTACGLVRVGLLTEPGNAPMRRAAAAAGFAEEGVLRAYLVQRRRRLDMAVLSLVAADLAADAAAGLPSDPATDPAAA